MLMQPFAAGLVLFIEPAGQGWRWSMGEERGFVFTSVNIDICACAVSVQRSKGEFKILGRGWGIPSSFPFLYMSIVLVIYPSSIVPV